MAALYLRPKSIAGFILRFQASWQYTFSVDIPMQELPVKSAAAAVKEAAKPGKRKGPLPLWLAEIFVILGISGILYAITRW